MQAATFDGATFDQARDGSRLNAQLQRVLKVMEDGKARFLHELAAEADAPEASVSARLRDLRKPKFGGYTIVREYVSAGLWSPRSVSG